MEDQQDETAKKAGFYPFAMNGNRKQEKRGDREREGKAIPPSVKEDISGGKDSVRCSCTPWTTLFRAGCVQVMNQTRAGCLAAGGVANMSFHRS